MEENSLSNISKIISSNGSDKDAWENLLCNIHSAESNNITEIIIFFNNNLDKKLDIEITLDIIDYLVFYGTQEIIESIAQKEFLTKILDLLKNNSGSSVNIQKTVIILTQKWAKKFENNSNSALSGFSENYNILKNGKIMFPPENYKFDTYAKYISDEEAQNALLKANALKKVKEDNKKSLNDKLEGEDNFANPFMKN